MADIAQLETALRNADAAGDVAAASQLAQALMQARQAPADNRTPAQRFVQDASAGLLRGAGSIGATLLAPMDALNARLTGRPAMAGNNERRQGMDAALSGMGADTDSMAFGGGKLVGEIAGTAGVGGALAGGLQTLPGAARVAPVLDAMRTGGFTAGGLTGARGVATRALGGGITGGAAAGLVNPEEAGTGAAVGAALPGVLQGIGAAGRAIGRAGRPGADPASQTKLLANALGIQESEVAAMLAKSRAAPTEIVPGSQLTMAQALQLQGANSPGVSLLERIVAGGPGGDALLKRYAAQGDARMAALQAQGAQTYQGAAREEATKAGDLIGSVLRTQAADDSAAARAAWEQVYKRGADEGVSLYLPLDEMKQALSTLGPGTVGAGSEARSLLREAQRIGTMQTEAIKATTDAASARPLTLAQAVRRAGGLSMRDNDGLLGELKGIKGDLKNLVRKNGGLTPGRMAEKMREAGYLPDEDADTLLQALRADAGTTPQYSMRDAPERSWQAARDAAMGEPPGAEAVPVPVPFDAFQRLRRSANALGARVGSRPGGEVESGVLQDIRSIITRKADSAASGNLAYDEALSPEFASQYNAARDMTRVNAERYKGGNNIASILRRPMGQDYSLTGDEIFGKLWHGGMGLAGDVSNLKQVLAPNNYDPAMGALQQAIMSDAASKTTAAGQFGAALPKYVESRLPGLQEAMTPAQLKTLKDVAADIRNAEAAASVQGLRGSDTQAKITRALDAGLIDGPLLKTLAKLVSIKGVGLENLRAKVSEAVMRSKGESIAELLANPAAATPAAAAPGTAPGGLLQSLAAQRAARLGLLSAPIVATDR